MKPLSKEDIRTFLSQLQVGWEVVDDKKIKKEFKFKDFIESLAFVNKVGEIAEEEGHHPDILLSYGRVVIELSTHDIGGLSEKDFTVAGRIELLV